MSPRVNSYLGYVVDMTPSRVIKRDGGDGWRRSRHPSPPSPSLLKCGRHVDRSLRSIRSGDIFLTYNEVDSLNSNLYKD